MEKLVVGLIKGRHDLPVDEYIVNEEINPVDFDKISEIVFKFIRSHCKIKKTNYPHFTCNYVGTLDEEFASSDVCLEVYVTGLTAVSVELVRQCAENGVKLTLMHYDKVTNSYVPQLIF